MWAELTKWLYSKEIQSLFIFQILMNKTTWLVPRTFEITRWLFLTFLTYKISFNISRVLSIFSFIIIIFFIRFNNISLKSQRIGFLAFFFGGGQKWSESPIDIFFVISIKKRFNLMYDNNTYRLNLKK